MSNYLTKVEMICNWLHSCGNVLKMTSKPLLHYAFSLPEVFDPNANATQMALRILYFVFSSYFATFRVLSKDTSYTTLSVIWT